MKLFDLKEPCKVVVKELPSIPVGSVPVGKGDSIFFHHVDGMYSFCEDSQGRAVHPAAWTKIERVE